ncbi:MAG: hypothetical protein VST70_10285 [Nitrospirota bacterium]|nr:hypothetical protein [Nitrospirota bacterium]
MNVTIKEKGILFRIRRTYHRGMDAQSLYEATQGAWRLGSRRLEALYAFALSGQEIVEVYEIEEWLPAGTLPYHTRNAHTFDRSRWEFKGQIASPAIREKYVGQTVSPTLLKGSSPTLYTWSV